MKHVFQQPYVLRIYPSPSTGTEIQVYVKEVLLIDYPANFVNKHGAKINDSGGALFSTDIRGMRQWDIEEFDSGIPTNEHPWQELWYIKRANTEIILDIIKYTEFYDHSKKDIYEEFRLIACRLDSAFGLRFLQACLGNVTVQLQNKPDKQSWEAIIDEMYSFNNKHFSTEESKESLSKRSRKGLLLFYGHC